MYNKKEKKELGNSFVLGKVPPQAKELEEVILGALMIDKNCVSVALARLMPEMFYSDANQRVFKAIQRTYDTNLPIDILNVSEQLKKTEEIDLVGGNYYITKLTNSVVSGANIESHIIIISERYLDREIIRICGDGLNNAYERSEDTWDNIGNIDTEIQKVQERVLVGMSKDIGFFGMKMLDQHATVKETGVIGISTGLECLDKIICGLVAPDLIIIAARPGQGKTALALSITYNSSILSNVPCAWFSLEMDGVQLVRRLVSIHTGIDHERIRNGKTTEQEDIILGESIEKISDCPIYIEDKASVNVRHIRTKAALLKRKYDIKFIVVDYIQLMEGVDSKGKNREQVISEISRALKLLAKELEIPVVALSQLSREVEKRPDRMPQLSDLRESGAIEQDADEVLFLMRPEYYKMTECVTISGDDYSVHGLCIASIAKNRHGSTKNTALTFTGSTMYFKDNVENKEFNKSTFKPNTQWQN